MQPWCKAEENSTAAPTQKKDPAFVPAETNNVVSITDASLTPEERAIANRVSTASDDWKTDPADWQDDFSLAEDPFKLPPPAQKLRDRKEFAFRWITRDPKRLDEMRSKSVPFKWWPVNSTQPAPGVFDAELDRVLGCVTREDQMLVFKPWWMFEKEQAFINGLADAAYLSNDVTAKNGQERDGMTFAAGKRSGNSAKTLREEVKAGDIQFAGEADYDRATGHETALVSESDLAVNE